jgi:diadenosine tetraphosphate (Ap4A) HIT family hydrolase
MNATLQNFGYPDSCVWQDQMWAVLLRPQQVTLGALVLCTRTSARHFSELPPDAATSHASIIQRIEQALQRFRPYDKFNILTLMMVDPHVHSHVLPRYAMAQSYGGIAFADPGWPVLPDLKHATDMPVSIRTSLLHDLKTAFESTALNA